MQSRSAFVMREEVRAERPEPLQAVRELSEKTRIGEGLVVRADEGLVDGFVVFADWDISNPAGLGTEGVGQRFGRALRYVSPVLLPSDGQEKRERILKNREASFHRVGDVLVGWALVELSRPVPTSGERFRAYLWRLFEEMSKTDKETGSPGAPPRRIGIWFLPKRRG
mgnify:FL=1